MVSLAIGFSLNCAERNAPVGVGGTASVEASDAIVAALGNLRVGRAPTRTEAVLSEALFGTAPEPSLNFVKPVDLRAAEGGLLVADGALSTVLFWRSAGADLAFTSLQTSPRSIAALAVAPNGDLLIADAGARQVLRTDAAGKVVRHYAPESAEFRPAGLAVVGAQLWVSNAAGHRIEVFDAGTGAYVRSIGRRGRGNGEFGIPLGIAVLRDGAVAIVDMLNCRVQVLAADGSWIRNIGGPGDVVGRFGRPRTIAVGPDGVIFVTDAASQRVHAFSPDGRALGAFGGESGDAAPLVLPAGLTVVTAPPTADRVASAAFGARYFILVSEQLLRPGIRVYAWRGPPPATAARDQQRVFASAVPSPHWSPQRCDTCHTMTPAGQPRPIVAAEVDRMCLECHDGTKAAQEAHPIGRRAVTAQTRAPADWPLVDGRIGCLTCHDIGAHCDPAAVRPAQNSALVRGFDPSEPLASCRNCHIAEQWRINPHRATDSASCAFCHSTPPPLNGGRRSGEASLHIDDSRICLGCHTPHADPAPRGHLGAAMGEPYRSNLARAREMLSADVSSVIDPLPIANDRITCYTCHNPHAPGLFPTSSDLGLRAAQEPFDLRLPAAALCIACHGK